MITTKQSLALPSRTTQKESVYPFDKTASNIWKLWSRSPFPSSDTFLSHQLCYLYLHVEAPLHIGSIPLQSLLRRSPRGIYSMPRIIWQTLGSTGRLLLYLDYRICIITHVAIVMGNTELVINYKPKTHINSNVPHFSWIQ